MTKWELVAYGRQSERRRRAAADELFRRAHDRALKKGLLENQAELPVLLHGVGRPRGPGRG